jgi:hypothetical protein
MPMVQRAHMLPRRIPGGKRSVAGIAGESPMVQGIHVLVRGNLRLEWFFAAVAEKLRIRPVPERVHVQKCAIPSVEKSIARVAIEPWGPVA